MNLLFSEGHRAWKGEKTLNQHPLLLLSNFFAAGGKSTGSKLPSPQRMEKGVSEFFESDRSWQQSGALWPWTCAGSVVRWRLCSPWSCSKPISDQGKCCHSNPRVSWHQRRWSPKLGDTVVPSGPHREQQNWRSRRYDQSRLKTMFVDRASVRKALRRQPQDKVFLNLNYAEYLLLLRRAAANLQVDMVPYQGRDSGASVDSAQKPANVGIHTGTADDGNQPSLCAATKKGDVSTKVGQSSLHWSRHNASIATTSCPQYCFTVTPLRHRLDCSVFCDRSLQCEHRWNRMCNSFS